MLEIIEQEIKEVGMRITLAAYYMQTAKSEEERQQYKKELEQLEKEEEKLRNKLAKCEEE